MTQLRADAAAWIDRRRSTIYDALSSFIAIPTESPDDQAADEWLQQYLSEAGGSLQWLPTHPDLDKHWSRSPHTGSQMNSEGRGSWRAELLQSEAPEARRTLFNAHVDVVPAGDAFPDAYVPEVRDGYLYGRGACDTKNNLVMLVEAIRFLREFEVPTRRSVWLDMPIEEEIGGNGTLSSILHGTDFDEAVCLEPTDLVVYRGHRGCLTFRLQIQGQSVHMGSNETGIDAIALAIEAIDALRSLEVELLETARTHPAFLEWDRPLQLNIGKITGGEWSGSVPEHCTVIGDLGFLPTHGLQDMEVLIRQRLSFIADRALAFDIDFHHGLRNDATLTEENMPIVKDLARAVKQPNVGGWRVSCDARLYDRVASLPTVIFGSGSLKDAHSPHERVDLHEFEEGIIALIEFIAAPNAAAHPLTARVKGIPSA